MFIINTVEAKNYVNSSPGTGQLENDVQLMDIGSPLTSESDNNLP